MTTQQVPRQQVEQVFRTKRGLHEFMTVECDYFLQPHKCTNHAWVREIWAGTKKVSLSHDKPDPGLEV